MLERIFNASWYGRWQWTWLLWPLSLLVSWITKNKRNAYLASPPDPFPVPVIVVGNITIGGTGKTPVVQSMVTFLKELGYRPGVVSRGYGGTIDTFPHEIKTSDGANEVGDEPCMLFQTLDVPVVIDPIRKRGVERLLTLGVDLVISDDGLQHYGLYRDYEVCVIDGTRGLGNAQLLPVGPLRESKDRLESVSYVLESAGEAAENAFSIEPMYWVNVKNSKRMPLDELDLPENSIAIAGIGNPEKFRLTLQDLGYVLKCKWFDDHYAYSEHDFESIPEHVLMTEKDAVKVKPFASENMWYLKISASLPKAFQQHLKNNLDQWKQDHG